MKMKEINQKQVGWLRDSLNKDKSFTVSVNTPVTQATEKMLENPYKVLVVVDNNKVVAVSTRTDITQSVSKMTQKGFDENTPIIELANKNFIRVQEDDTVEYLINTLLKNNLDHMVISDKQGQFLGIVDRKQLASELEHLVS